MNQLLSPLYTLQNGLDEEEAQCYIDEMNVGFMNVQLSNVV